MSRNKFQLPVDGRRYRFGFKGKCQLPLFMVWWEDWYNGEVTFGHVTFSTRHRADRAIIAGCTAMVVGVMLAVLK